MADKPNVATNVVTGLQALNAQGAAGIATRGALSHAPLVAANVGVLPGRKVYDPITGQFGEVVGSATVYLPDAQLPQGGNSGE